MSKDAENDWQLFRRAMADVRRLPERDEVPRRMPSAEPRAVPRKRSEREQVLAESLEIPASERLLETGEELLFRAPALSLAAWRRLRRGEWAVEDELDLHGLTAEQAHGVLADFIAACIRRRLRCVRVVHGKGIGSGPRGPVLKTLVDHWLRRWQAVLGFASAPPRDGGTGAVYVLLQRR